MEKDELKKIADLAHIDIGMDEEKIIADLKDILDYVEKLKEVDTSKIDSESISPILNRVRNDIPEDIDEATKEEMRTMGKNKDNYFQVESI